MNKEMPPSNLQIIALGVLKNPTIMADTETSKNGVPLHPFPLSPTQGLHCRITPEVEDYG